VPPAREAALQDKLAGLDVPVSRIGQIEVEAGLRCLDAGGEYYMPHGTGYEHFAASEGGESS
jgi:thiamine monophosphate kinase